MAENWLVAFGRQPEDHAATSCVAVLAFGKATDLCNDGMNMRGSPLKERS
jgi:hypothetical protein